MNAISEAITAAREARAKSDVLQEARIEAHGIMREASAQHEFLVSACRDAEKDEGNAVARVEREIRLAAHEALGT